MRPLDNMKALIPGFCVGVTFFVTAGCLENLALNKEFKGYATNSYPFDGKYAADKAVDGHLQEENGENTCSFTQAEVSKTAWWKFTLRRLANIAYLQIYFRKGTVNRHTGFSVFAFNESSYTPPSHNGAKVFTQDWLSCPSQEMRVNVSKLAKGIAIFNSKEPPLSTSCEGYEPTFATTEVCEVKVMGCKSHYYGEPCKSCSTKCLNRQCDVDDGSCIYGCSANFMNPPGCSICNIGYYGQNCEHMCGKCKTGTYCNTITGICPNGCQNRWNGSKCDVCKNGYYDNNCTRTCGHCKPGTYCHNITGICPEGCNDRWDGPKCEVCRKGLYGSNCENKCGNCINGTHCNFITGICADGCQRHWNGSKCEVCKGGYYGPNCKHTCGKCKAGTFCDNITGICPGGCQKRWSGSKCDICKGGYYGNKCEYTCGQCKAGTFCNNITGNCPKGCQNRWGGSKCERCENGFYDDNCRQTCGYCRSGTYCHNITGICQEGCDDRWDGSKCDMCKKGFYGTFCENICGRCKNGTYCNNITGICADGCQSQWNGTKCDICENGFFGSSCNEECRYCKQNVCNKDNGHCMIGCQGNRKGVKCDSLSLPFKESSGGVIGGVITSLIIFIMLVICAAIFVRRRLKISKDSAKRRGSIVKSENECKISYRKQTNVSSNLSQTSLQVQLPSLDFAGDFEYYNTSQISKDIKIEDLQNYIATKSAGKENPFLMEYKGLPPKDENKCHAARRKENVTKNRFKTTFPYDHSRVILEEKWDGHDNDYINANYLKDCNGERRFIAAQGPQNNTLKDFWRLIWQENIGCIIMLTNLVENGKNKCTKYWPDRNQPMNVGPCKVFLLKETTYAFYTVRQFSIQRKNVHSEEVRTVNQFHYTAWPDHGTPGAIELNQFHRTVTKSYQPGPPLLVHCSAGVGRTGTYIGLNVLLQQGREKGRINVFEFVKQMREDRMTMVQTVEQYVFLHKALLCGFQERGVILSERDLQANVLTLLNDTSPFNQQTLTNEFQIVSAFKAVDEDGSKENANKLENRSKNVDMDIYPVSKYRPYLTTYVKGRNDYINAVIVPTFTNQNGFIMTQKPLLDTEVDLWRLCMDHGVTAIVVLNDSDEENNWLPNRGETRHCQPFTVTAKNTGSDINGVLQDSLLISKNNQKAHVDIYQTPSGNDEALVKCAKMLLQKDNASTSSSLVVSKNGAGPAGIFCILHNAIQQLSIDGEVDILTGVRQIQTRRPEVITTLEEYRKCYHLVSRSVSSEEIYVNF